MKLETVIEVVKTLTGSCFPYGDTNIDEKRYDNLLLKIGVVEDLIYEIIEAGRLYERKEFSVLHISNKANQYLVDLRDTLMEIDYLPVLEYTSQCGDAWYTLEPDDDWFCANGERSEE